MSGLGFVYDEMHRNAEDEEEGAMKMKNDFREFWVFDLCEK